MPYDQVNDWQLYEMSITEFFAANDIAARANAYDPDLCKSALLKTNGIRALEIICSLCAPVNPST